jgi:sugar lactone lactonase YvrE
MAAFETTVLLDGLAFPEGPRWHEERLWFSDQHARRVMTVDPDGNAELVVDVPECPSGLGFLPDGRLLVVSMRDRRLLRLEPGARLAEVADLSSLAPWHCNDMVVDTQGRAYVGNFGFDLDGGAPAVTTCMILVTPDGATRVVADDLKFPNGTVITPDGATLVVGESFRGRLDAFDIEPDGALTGRRTWAKLTGAVPDGICLDADGAIWVACPVTGRALRVREGGEVTDEVAAGRPVFACMLGGGDRRTLFLCTAEVSDPEETIKLMSGRIETVRVDVPGAGLP